MTDSSGTRERSPGVVRFWRREPVAAGVLASLALAVVALAIALASVQRGITRRADVERRALAEDAMRKDPTSYCRAWAPYRRNLQPEQPPLCEQAERAQTARCSFDTDKRQRLLDALAFRIDGRLSQQYRALANADIGELVRTKPGADALFEALTREVLAEALDDEDVTQAAVQLGVENTSVTTASWAKALFLERVAVMLMVAEKRLIEMAPTKLDDVDLIALFRAYSAEEFDSTVYATHVEELVEQVQASAR